MHIEGGDKEMKVSHNITDTEKSVMDILWDRPDAVATRELLDLMKEKGKNWKRQTCLLYTSPSPRDTR